MSRDLTTMAPVKADERIRYGASPSQFFDLWRAAGEARGLAAVVHGGFWRARYDLGHVSHLCAALARAGFTTVNVEYRRVGEPGGGWPGSFDDVKTAVETASRNIGLPPIVLGHSAGGHLALRAASDLELRGVVALAPVADLRRAWELDLSNGAVREFLGGTPAEIPLIYEAACASRHASAVPRAILHDVKDDVVPIELSRKFERARRADSGQVNLIELSDADHMGLIDPESKAWSSVLQAVLEVGD